MALFTLALWAFSVFTGPGFDRYLPLDQGFGAVPAAGAHYAQHGAGAARPMDTDMGGPS